MDEKSLFLAALEIEDETVREQFLVEKCHGDSALLAQVLSLLAAHRESADFLKSGEGPLAGLEQTLVSDASSASSPGMHLAVKQLLGPSDNPRAIGGLGHYSILEVLGQGAFGIVLRAFDEKLHRVVAIKVLNPEVATTSPPRKRFLREARSAAAVKHENVVQVYSVEEQPIPYLVMEFIDGPTLQQRLDNTGPLDIAEVTKLSFQIACGLAAAHAKGLIHRDIKPGNILIEEGVESKVKITDFGLARAADDASMTRTGTIAGTPLYMAPEQAKGQELDHRADLFSLGSVMYQMVSGRPPFRAENSVAVLLRVVNDTPRSIHEIQPDVPKWFTAIVSKLHEKRPENRFQSAQEVANLLSQRFTELTKGMRPVDGPSVSPRPIKTKFVFASLAACALVLVGGLATWQPWNRRASSNSIANWTDRVEKMSGTEQVVEFTAELKRRNPKWDGVVVPKVQDGKVVSVQFDSLGVADLQPVGALTSLKDLDMASSADNPILTDITPLSSLQLLETFSLRHCSSVSDISSLKSLPLINVNLEYSAVRDLSPLLGKPLRYLNCIYCSQLADVSPVRGAPMDIFLGLGHTAVKDLSPLKESKVVSINCNAELIEGNWDVIRNWKLWSYHWFGPIPTESLQKLCTLSTLKEIDSTPLDQYMAKHGGEIRTQTNAEDITPWIDRTASLSAEKQVSEFIAEMKRRNPKWDEKVESKVEEGRVVEVRFDALHVKVIAPIACFRHLKTVTANASKPNDELIDISPLSQCKSIEWVSLHNVTRLQDLSPLRELPLIDVLVSGSSVSNLEPLRGKQLSQFNGIYCSQLKDLSPLEGAPLGSYLGLAHSGVADFSVLRNSKVTHLNCTANQLAENWVTIRDWPLQYLQVFSEIPTSILEKLRTLKTLKEIDGIPVDQYFKEHSPQTSHDVEEVPA